MNEYKIDSNVPAPPARPHGNYKYPWGEMKEGDSFFLPKREGYTARDTGNLAYMSGRQWLSRNNTTHLKVCQRLATENGVEGSRIWLVKKVGNWRTGKDK